MKVLSKIIMFIFAAALLVTGLLLEKKLNEYRTALDLKTERVMEVRKGRNVDFAKLSSENKDTVGWIYLPDSNIDYPVVQGNDNDYYLNRDFSGSYLFDGTIFVDAANGPLFTDDNTIIYGHRMISGAMFADLKQYEDSEYMESHRIVQFETPAKSYDLHVVAFCMEDATSDLYRTFFSDPALVPRPAPGSAEGSSETDGDAAPLDAPALLTKKEYVKHIKDCAVTLSGEPFSENDRFVTLSTCARSLGDDRNQVICVVKDATKEEKEVTSTQKKRFVNKWLIMQVAVGLVLIIALAALLLPAKKRKQS